MMEDKMNKEDKMNNANETGDGTADFERSHVRANDESLMHILGKTTGYCVLSAYRCACGRDLDDRNVLNEKQMARLGDALKVNNLGHIPVFSGHDEPAWGKFGEVARDASGNEVLKTVREEAFIVPVYERNGWTVPFETLRHICMNLAGMDNQEAILVVPPLGEPYFAVTKPSEGKVFGEVVKSHRGLSLKRLGGLSLDALLQRYFALLNEEKDGDSSPRTFWFNEDFRTYSGGHARFCQGEICRAYRPRAHVRSVTLFSLGNPYANMGTPSWINDDFNDYLANHLRSGGFIFKQTSGRFGDFAYDFIVFDLTLEMAKGLAARYRMPSFVHGERRGPCEFGMPLEYREYSLDDDYLESLRVKWAEVNEKKLHFDIVTDAVARVHVEIPENVQPFSGWIRYPSVDEAKYAAFEISGAEDAILKDVFAAVEGQYEVARKNLGSSRYGEFVAEKSMRNRFGWQARCQFRRAGAFRSVGLA